MGSSCCCEELYFDGAPSSAAEAEAKRRRIARDCGLPVPRVFEVTQMQGRQALVMDACRSRGLSDRIGLTAESQPAFAFDTI